MTLEFAEVCWFYDFDARPSMHEGPAPVNVFGRSDEDAGAFFARSRAMRRSGMTGLLIERPGGPEVDQPIPYCDPGDEAPLAPHTTTVNGRLLSVVSDGSECMIAGSDDGGLSSRVLGKIGEGECGDIAAVHEATPAPSHTTLTGDVHRTVWAAIGYDDGSPIRLVRSVPHCPSDDPPAIAWEPAHDTGLVGSSPSNTGWRWPDTVHSRRRTRTSGASTAPPQPSTTG